MSLSKKKTRPSLKDLTWTLYTLSMLDIDDGLRKAIEESKLGKSSFLTLPCQSYINLLLEAGAELRSLGRVKWLEVETKEPMKSPSPITGFYLRGLK